MKIIKKSLSLSEMCTFTQRVCDICFDQDESGKDIAYTPIFKIPTILELTATMFTDYQKDKDADVNCANYVEMNLDEYLCEIPVLNMIVDAIDEAIEFRKQKMLQDDDTSKYITKILEKELENQNLQTELLEKQKEILEQQKEINGQYTKEEIDNYVEVFGNINKLAENPEYLKAVANTVHYDKTIKSLQDHKTPSKPKTAKKPRAKKVVAEVDGE